MVTKRDLEAKRMRKQRAAEEAARESERRTAEWRAERMKNDLAFAKTAVDGELGKLLEKAEDEGLRYISYGNNRFWKSNHNGTGREEWYGNRAEGMFAPDPSYKPTHELLQRLRTAGFKADLETRHEDDTEFVNDADGGRFESTGGTHPEYYINISW